MSPLLAVRCLITQRLPAQQALRRSASEWPAAGKHSWQPAWGGSRRRLQSGVAGRARCPARRPGRWRSYGARSMALACSPRSAGPVAAVTAVEEMRRRQAGSAAVAWEAAGWAAGGMRHRHQAGWAAAGWVEAGWAAAGWVAAGLAVGDQAADLAAEAQRTKAWSAQSRTRPGSRPAHTRCLMRHRPRFRSARWPLRTAPA